MTAQTFNVEEKQYTSTAGKKVLKLCFVADTLFMETRKMEKCPFLKISNFRGSPHIDQRGKHPPANKTSVSNVKAHKIFPITVDLGTAKVH